MSILKEFGSRVQHAGQSTSHWHGDITGVANSNVCAGNQLGNDLSGGKVRSGDCQAVRAGVCAGV